MASINHSVSGPIDAGPWLSSHGRKESERAAVRLFCLPHAGAGTAAYNVWRRLLPPWIAVSPVQIPGREGRLAEASLTNLEELIEGITHGIAGHLDKPFAIFGHSMGALLALELAQSLRAHGLQEPSLLFVSGRNAAHVPIKHRSIHAMGDAEFLDALETRYGGLPREIRDTPELVEMYLPILRADLTLLESHRYRHREPLECGIAALSGRDDANVSKSGLEAWREHTTGGFETRWFEGGHFYLSGPSRGELLGALTERLGEVMAAAQTAAKERG